MTLKQALLCSTLMAVAAPVVGEETRELGAHEHGHGGLNIAVDGDVLAIELTAPGYDIVGFEYAAKSDADKAAIDAGLAKLSDPLSLFGLPDGANCTVTSAKAELHSEDEHHDDHHDEHDEKHDDHDHDKVHAEHEGHDHDDQEKDHDDHEDHAAEGHEDHDEHDHDDHDEENHSEFHAEYQLSCANPAELTSIALSYFAQFPNAKELEVQLVTDTGASKVEATAAAPVVTLN